MKYQNEIVKGERIMAIAVDGWWGKATIIALNVYFGVSRYDGHVHNQWAPNIQENTALVPDCWETSSNPTGDVMIRSLQNVLGVYADGVIGTDTIKALQNRMGTPVDGVLTGPSPCVMELQRRLNRGVI